MHLHSDFQRKPTLLLALAASLALGVLSLLFAMKEDRWTFFAGYCRNPLILLLNLLPCVMLMALLFALTGRAAAAFPLAGAVVMGFTWTGWFKLQFRSDPLLAQDLNLLREAGDMAGKYRMFLPKGLAVTLLCIVSGTAVLARFARWKPARKTRLLAAAAMLALLLPMQAVYFNNTVYTKLTQSCAASGPWDTTRNYQSKGFVYPFLHSFRKLLAVAPEGYRASESESRLAERYTPDLPDMKKVSLIAVMLESFCDFTNVPNAPELATEVYAPYHRLEWEGVSGTLVTNIFAGGTVDSERAFLTGYPEMPSFRSPTNSYVWYLRGQGYHTFSSHPGSAWFYQREEINRRLGFQEGLFRENYFGACADGGIASDDILFSELSRLCLEQKDPYFSFTVSYQGHGPYPADENTWDGEYIRNQGYSEEEYHILNHYFGSVANTGKNIAAMADALRESDTPTVLLVFGDHKPWLGDNQSVYRSLGIPIGCGTDEGFLCHYSTQYLIWGNQAAKEALGKTLQGKGPTVSPSMLMCTLFDTLGWSGPPLMQEQRELLRSGVGMYHPTAGNALFQDKLCLPDELPEPSRSLLQRYLCDAYYEQTHFHYPEQ